MKCDPSTERALDAPLTSGCSGMEEIAPCALRQPVPNGVLARPASSILLAVLLPSPASAAEDDEIRSKLRKLADRRCRRPPRGDRGPRPDARRARRPKVLQACSQGNLVRTQGSKAPVVLRGETTSGCRRKTSVGLLLDPLTQEPLLDPAKKPLVGRRRRAAATICRRRGRNGRSCRMSSRSCRTLRRPIPKSGWLAVRRLGENPDRDISRDARTTSPKATPTRASAARPAKVPH